MLESFAPTAFSSFPAPGNGAACRATENAAIATALAAPMQKYLRVMLISFVSEFLRGTTLDRSFRLRTSLRCDGALRVRCSRCGRLIRLAMAKVAYRPGALERSTPAEVRLGSCPRW